ncbi:low molecular weight protein arginine phosphatase [Clostridium sp. MB40-C1]|uniref:low molecular weight protein arginine phosphatase n=1 Tax=Clostridium sp. MB40-C1 TaxID=3070996 RepID=UPI0027E02936|nr:low molecular weight protein arginine phosphatase [Clostridium sp. MB40-C1]WMJ79683.1 low molecular weight protein arginine phosphatase [Clostridium sp. MB40-C1]
MQVLFVCTGNTCRSCMAESIFNSISNTDNVRAISAGIAVVPGSKTSENTSLLIKENFSIDLSSRCSVQLQEEMLKECNLILTMTSYIKDILVEKFKQYKDKIYTLSEYVDFKEDIVDPYGGDLEVYRNTFDMLKEAICLLLNKIKEDNGI